MPPKNTEYAFTKLQSKEEQLREAAHSYSRTETMLTIGACILTLTNLYNVIQTTANKPSLDTHLLTTPDTFVSELATETAGRELTVYCNDPILENLSAESNEYYDTNSFVQGVVSRDIRDTIILRENLCDILEMPDVNSDIGSSINYTHASYTLLHEIEHIYGEYNEAAATCYAGQKLEDFVGNKLTPDTSRIATEAVVQWLPTVLSDEYLSEECKDNGELDIDEASHFIAQIYRKAHK